MFAAQPWLHSSAKTVTLIFLLHLISVTPIRDLFRRYQMFLCLIDAFSKRDIDRGLLWRYQVFDCHICCTYCSTSANNLIASQEDKASGELLKLLKSRRCSPVSNIPSEMEIHH